MSGAVSLSEYYQTGEALKSLAVGADSPSVVVMGFPSVA